MRRGWSSMIGFVVRKYVDVQLKSFDPVLKAYAVRVLSLLCGKQLFRFSVPWPLNPCETSEAPTEPPKGFHIFAVS